MSNTSAQSCTVCYISHFKKKFNLIRIIPFALLAARRLRISGWRVLGLFSLALSEIDLECVNIYISPIRESQIHKGMSW
jgi:hypothetical protein